MRWLLMAPRWLALRPGWPLQWTRRSSRPSPPLMPRMPMTFSGDPCLHCWWSHSLLKIASADLSAMDVSHCRSRRKALLLTCNYCEGSYTCQGMCSVCGLHGHANTCTFAHTREQYSYLLLCTAAVKMTKINCVFLSFCSFVLLFMLPRITIAAVVKTDKY